MPLPPSPDSPQIDSSRLPPERLSASDSIWIAIVGVTIQLAIAALGLPGSGRRLFGDEVMYLRLARAWAAGEELTLDLLWPAGYPALLTAWIRVFPGETDWLVLQAAAHLVAAILLAHLTTVIAVDRRVGVFAGLLFVADPQIASFAQGYRPETLFFAAALGLVWMAWRSTPELATAGAVGLLSGLCLLLKSVAGPFIPFLVWGFARRAQTGKRLAVGALAAGVLLLTVAPFVATNLHRQGYFGISNSTAFNLALGLTDRSPRSLVDDRATAAFAAYQASGDRFAQRQQALWGKVRQHLAEHGILHSLADQFPRQYFRLFDRESYFLAALPGGSIALEAQGPGRPASWLDRGLTAWSHGIYIVILLGAPWGLALLLWRQRPGVVAALCWLISLLGLFFVFHVKSRYRVLLLPVLDLGAAAGLVRWVMPQRAGDAGPRGKVPLMWHVVAAAISLALLFFAFGAPI